MPLSDLQCKNAKYNPDGKGNKLADGDSLFLFLMPTGSKLWRFLYRDANKKQKTLSIGAYPEISLQAARKKREEARTVIAAGGDPSQAKKEQRRAAEIAASNDLESVARAWMTERGKIVEVGQYEKTMSRFVRDVFPYIGKRPIHEVDAPEILTVMKRIAGRGAAYTADRIRNELSMIFRFGIKHGYCKMDPARDLIGAINVPRSKHFAALTDWRDVGELLRAMDGFRGTLVVQCALKLSPLLFQRPGELRKAEWEQVDLERGEWRYHVKKTDTEHLVPLATQALAILKELHATTGNGKYVFPGVRDKDRPMSEASINAALQRMGYDTQKEITGHGFRAMARTLIHEELEERPEHIEQQLAHAVPDMNGRAYNRTKFVRARKVMMQKWADLLDQLKAGTYVPADNEED
ncbi:tyrosine-type recombinase/integrase [Burkholderia vietnamiensis]|uniref:tyrosine-type recombinase/integrase n=1 Tax=Burkholderia vietnamiensis TaxID=60552 RepID=UPI001CF5BF61|nr:integrase arm-type DNA-binding domain-containing protein [Burkholderia vietnamiensis]MCA8144457.1 integrase arm-type DNA-binding domain-containing protein [Burkholderia vietnamiensis]